MASQQQRQVPIPHIFPQLILKVAERVFSRKGMIEEYELCDRDAGRVTFDTLPDDVLLDIFDFYSMDSSDYPWRWHMLVHVCRRWRQIIFASPRRLDLQFLCTPRTRVRELLEFVPPMPIMICNNFDQTPGSARSFEDGSQVIAAVEQCDQVWCVQLEDLPSTLLEKLATIMKETYPLLTYVQLWAGDEMAPILPKEFLGGSAPLLETLRLRGVPFPEVPKLLVSTPFLVCLQLENIPDSGFFSPEAMVTSLFTCPKLETLIIEFLSPYAHPDLTSQQITSITRASLPALNCFSFKGNGGYLSVLFPRIETNLFALSIIPTADRYVHYEASLTTSGFFFCYRNDRLEDLVPEEE